MCIGILKPCCHCLYSGYDDLCHPHTVCVVLSRHRFDCLSCMIPSLNTGNPRIPNSSNLSILVIEMGFFGVSVFILAVFQTGLSQQETCQADVVVTSQGALKRQIKEEIAAAFQSFTCVTDGFVTTPATDTFTAGLTEQAIARIENKLNNITDKLDSLEKRMDALHELGSTPCHAAGSCAEILEKDRSSPSGYYWVTNGTGHPHSVYCDMTRSCGGVTGGWMRVAYLDMTNSSHQCPSGLRQRTDSGVRSCAAYSFSRTCSSVLYRSHGVQITWCPILSTVWKD